MCVAGLLPEVSASNSCFLGGWGRSGPAANDSRADIPFEKAIAFGSRRRRKKDGRARGSASHVFTPRVHAEFSVSLWEGCMLQREGASFIAAGGE